MHPMLQNQAALLALNPASQVEITTAFPFTGKDWLLHAATLPKDNAIELSADALMNFLLFTIVLI